LVDHLSQPYGACRGPPPDFHKDSRPVKKHVVFISSSTQALYVSDRDGFSGTVA
jgi:hypothetical protein